LAKDGFEKGQGNGAAKSRPNAKREEKRKRGGGVKRERSIVIVSWALCSTKEKRGKGKRGKTSMGEKTPLAMLTAMNYPTARSCVRREHPNTQKGGKEKGRKEKGKGGIFDHPHLTLRTKMIQPRPKKRETRNDSPPPLC